VDAKELWILTLLCSRFRTVGNDASLWRNACLRWWTDSAFDIQFKVNTSELTERMCAAEKWGFTWPFFGRCLQRRGMKESLTWRLNIFQTGLGGKMEQQLEIGQVKEGKLHGRGMYFLEDCENYIGEFHENIRKGIGLFTWPNGNRYEGGFQEDLKNGFGILYLSSGSIYSGNWKDGNSHGMGKLVLPDGFTFVGEFDKGKPVDKEMCLHPKVRECLRERKCSGISTQKHTFYGQFIFICRTCGDLRNYCVACKDTCHPIAHNDWEEFWTWGLYTCDCFNKFPQLCQSGPDHTHDSKRLKLEFIEEEVKGPQDSE
jgi:hypothetical protein